VADGAQLLANGGVHEPLGRLGPPVAHGEDLHSRLPLCEQVAVLAGRLIATNGTLG
jgi:hypothetical protein